MATEEDVICPVQTSWEEEFRPNSFENTYSIRVWHSGSARFGKPSDMRLLIEGNKEDGQDYLRGLLASSIIIFCVAVVWCCLLLVFKCWGPRKCGWLSGQNIPIPAEPDAKCYSNGGVNDPAYLEDTEERQTKLEKVHRTRKILKSIVIFSGLGIMASAIMLSVKGVDSLLHTLDGIDKVLDVVHDLTVDGIELIDEIVGNETLVFSDTEDVLGAVNGLCPEIRFPICTDTRDPDSCNFDNITLNGDVLLDFVRLALDAGSLVDEELLKSRADLVDLQETTENMRDFGDTFNWAFYCSMVFSLLLALICLVFVYSAVRPLSKWNRRIQNWLLVPIFVLMVVLSWVFAIVFVIGSVGLADLCYDSPDDNFQALLRQTSGHFTPLIFNAIVYYVSGCPADSSIGREIIDFLILSLEIIGSITLAQGAFVEDTSILCDGAGIAQAEIDIVSQRLSTQVCKTTINLVDFRDLMSCDNWYPLYEESMYNSLCYDATDGFAWVTTTQIAIVFLSLLIVTSRSVYYEIETEDATAVHNKLNYKNDNEATENNDLQLQENHENEITTPEIELQESPQPQEESNVKAEDS